MSKAPCRDLISTGQVKLGETEGAIMKLKVGKAPVIGSISAEKLKCVSVVAEWM